MLRFFKSLLTSSFRKQTSLNERRPLPGFRSSTDTRGIETVDEPRTSGGQAFSLIEGLPPELRLHLLHCMPDIKTLRTLVHASPIFHQQYLLNQDSLLRDCLVSELGDVFVDSYAAFISRQSGFQSTQADQEIFSFLQCYRFWRSGAISIPESEDYGSAHLRWLAHYHTMIVLPVAGSLTSWALAGLEEAAASAVMEQTARTDPDILDFAGAYSADLSGSEMTRITRALYRYATYYHLFGPSNGCETSFSTSDIVNLYWEQFEPWEAEEIGCIDVFMRQEYEAVLPRAKEELHPLHPRNIEHLLYNPRAHDIEQDLRGHVTGTINKGLEVSARILMAAVQDHSALVEVLAENISQDLGTSKDISNTQMSSALWDRRDEALKPNLKDEAEAAHKSLPFLGDAICLKGPPLAWVMLWEGKYVNLYGGVLPERLRNMAWVFWDAGRLGSSGAKAYIEKMWEMEPEALQIIKRDYLESQ